MKFSTETLEKPEVLEKIADPYQVVVENDDVNTFDHVAECLMSICDHSFEQAYQCATIIHINGECAVISGGEEEMGKKAEALRTMLIKARCEKIT